MPEKICEACFVGKQPRHSFNAHLPRRALGLLHVVHSDVCEPFEIPSLRGNRYVTSFVDEYNRMMWLYLIKAKNEVFNIFQRFKAMAERQSGRIIKILRTDGGGEHTSSEFESFCEKFGILLEVTTLYTP